MTAAVLAGLTIPLAGIGAASAASSTWELFHFEGRPEAMDDFCGVPGLTVENSFVVDGRFRIKAHGSDGVPEYSDFSQSTDTFANVTTGDWRPSWRSSEKLTKPRTTVMAR
jgi:hypothetical protein